MSIRWFASLYSRNYQTWGKNQSRSCVPRFHTSPALPCWHACPMYICLCMRPCVYVHAWHNACMHGTMLACIHDHVFMYLCIYVFMYLCIYEFMNLWIYVFMYLCLSVCLSVCLIVCLSVCLSVSLNPPFLQAMCVCMSLYNAMSCNVMKCGM